MCGGRNPRDIINTFYMANTKNMTRCLDINKLVLAVKLQYQSNSEKPHLTKDNQLASA